MEAQPQRLLRTAFALAGAVARRQIKEALQAIAVSTKTEPGRDGCVGLGHGYVLLVLTLLQQDGQSFVVIGHRVELPCL